MNISIPEAVAETLQECKRFVYVKQHSFTASVWHNVISEVCENVCSSNEECMDSSSCVTRKMPRFPLKGNGEPKKSAIMLITQQIRK